MNPEQFIAQMKLQELQKQREQTLAVYAKLEQSLATLPSEREQLRQLYAQLRQLTFAHQPFHPEVANLEPLLDQHASPSPELISVWRAQLAQTLAQGQLRTEVVYLFGRVLEELAVAEPRPPAADAPTPALVAPLLSAQPVDARWLLAQVDALGWTGEQARAKLANGVDVYIHAKVVPEELTGVLRQIAVEPHWPLAHRQAARTFLDQPLQLKELCDALTIASAHLDTWSWPADGVPVQAEWSHTKWRTFLQEDFTTAVLLDLLGRRWLSMLNDWTSQLTAIQLDQLQTQLRATERSDWPQPLRHLAEQVLLNNHWVKRGGVDLWQTAATPLQTEMLRWGRIGSIQYQRHEWRAMINRQAAEDGLYADEYSAGLDYALLQINAEVRTARAAHPDQPLYVLKLDIQSFYPSLNHELLLALLEHWGLEPAELDFWRRWLSLPLQTSSGVQIAQSGLPIQRALSDALAELLLRVLDGYVTQQAAVLVVRAVDDITLIAASADAARAGLQAVQTFCAQTGLALNMAKCGAVCIGGTLPADLPQALPSWMFVQLDASGAWGIDQQAVADYLAQWRAHLDPRAPILEQVELYNQAQSYLTTALGLRVTLDEQHRAQVGAALALLHSTDIVDTVRQQLRERFGMTQALPEAWFYWPLTAGGLGLRQLGLTQALYARQQHEWLAQQSLPKQREPLWQQVDTTWGGFYIRCCQALSLSEPTSNAVLETLVNDFIARGGELSNDRQTTLSPYWRWILYLYGPQILAAFGSFRFLFTELVPLQLIRQV